MDKDTLHEVDEVMVDKVSVAFCLALGNLCLVAKIPYPVARNLVDLCGIALGLQPLDIHVVFYAVEQLTKDPTFMDQHKATEEQILKAMWPGKKNHG